MRKIKRLWIGAAVAMTLSSARLLHAQVRSPYQVLDEEPDNVYVDSATPRPDQLTNQGGVHFHFETLYLSTYMYRGVDQSTPPERNEQALQFDARLEFDLGKLPHPFIGVFSNIFNDDPVSRFEEIRPYAGLEWTVRPVTVATGFNGYIFPNRQGVDTQEVWARISVDDSRFFHTEQPFLSPYVYGAYDFDRYNGFYLEAGVKHDFVIGDTGIIFTAVGDFAYVAHDRFFRGLGPKPADTGLQHYDAGVILTYQIGRGLHIPRQFGEWNVKGMLFYTGPVNEQQLRGDSRIWGGVGLEFRY
jgi:hypothetical protein